MFVLGDQIQHVITDNVYRVDEGGLTLLELNDALKPILKAAEAIGIPIDDLSVGTTFPFDLVDPNDFPEDFVKVN